jgi:hypothetical protein
MIHIINIMDNKDGDNVKKLLCINILNKQKCNYGNKCMYAHTLSEQKIEPLRHKVYTIIKCADDLSNMDLISDINLYHTMLQMTRVCSACSKGICSGGYNCRYGTVNIKYKICYEDLVHGNCKKPNCQSVHLTERGLIPYNKQKNKEKYNNFKKSGDVFEDSDSTKQNKIYRTYPLNNINNRLKKELDEVKGILITENFLINHFGKLDEEHNASDSDKEEDTAAIMNYINNIDNDSDEESIFLV